MMPMSSGGLAKIWFGDTIKVMAIITGVGGSDLRDARVAPDKLEVTLKLTKKQSQAGMKH